MTFIAQIIIFWDPMNKTLEPLGELMSTTIRLSFGVLFWHRIQRGKHFSFKGKANGFEAKCPKIDSIDH